MLSVFVFCTRLGHALVAPDVLELANGVTTEGKILNSSETPRKSWQVQMTEGVTVELPNKTTANRPMSQPQASDQYYAKVPFLPESVETHLKLAEVCMAQRLESLAQLHYQRVLDMDPENVTAHTALNHRKIDGEWISNDEIMLRQGYVKTNRGWTTPQKLMIDERQVQIGRENRESSQTAQNLVAQFKANPGQETENALLHLDDPNAVSVLADALKNEPNPKFRDIYVRALAKIRTEPADYEIAQCAMRENDENVAQTCITILQDLSGTSKFFVPYLTSRDNITINRAAYILGQLSDRTAIPPLIDALITQHEMVVSQNKSNDNHRSPSQKENVLVSNPDVLTTLRKLSGQNFGYDIPVWWDWWAEQNQIRDFDARRGSRD